MPTQLLVAAIIFLAVFIQSISGFGSALVAMALLPAVISIQTATPLIALVMTIIEIFLLIRYRHAFEFAAVWRLIAASLMGIPLGILFLSRIDERVVLALLGVVILGYVGYALFNEFTARQLVPALKHPAWAYGVGLIAGILGGAYNTSGPPVIIYGNSRRWEAAAFKGNLQVFFLFTSLTTVLGHAWNGGLTSHVWRNLFWSLPAIAAGLIAGTSLDQRLPPKIFRRIVLLILGIMGINLIRML